MDKRLNLGCGRNELPGFVNIDVRENLKPDLVCDVSDGLPFKDNSISEIRAIDFLEHIPIGRTVFVLSEIWRVLRPGFPFIHSTPSTDGRGAFMDPTHKSFWNVNSWLYFTDDQFRKIHDIPFKFTGENQDVVTDHQLRIIHTQGVLRPIKSPRFHPLKGGKHYADSRVEKTGKPGPALRVPE